MASHFCIFCGTPTYNPNLLCSEDCYDGYKPALEETKVIPALADDECPTCGPAEGCTCSYVPAPLEECKFCGEVFCICDREPWSSDDDYTLEPFDCDLWNER